MKFLRATRRRRLQSANDHVLVDCNSKLKRIPAFGRCSHADPTVGVSWLACTMSLAALVTSAEAVTDFYQGKSVHVLVGYAVGGGYDTYGRAVAEVLGRHLPGNPSVLVQICRADGLLLANHMAQRAPHDGTAIAVTNRSLAVSPLLGLVSASNIRYEPTKLQWLASLNSEVSLLIVRKELGIRRLEDLQGRPIRVGSTGSLRTTPFIPTLNNLFGTQVKVVTGYRAGTSHLALALERNEIDGVAGWAWSSLRLQRPDWIRDGKVVLVLQLGTERVPELKDVPLILDLARSDDERHALELYFLRRQWEGRSSLPRGARRRRPSPCCATHSQQPSKIPSSDPWRSGPGST